MSLQYNILTTVLFRHNYFPDNNYRGFSIEPDSPTRHNLQRLSLICKNVPGGFHIFYEADTNNTKAREEIVRQPVTLSFIVNNIDTDFVSYTEGVPGNIESVILYFKNLIKVDAKDGEPGLMHQNDFFSATDIIYNRQPENESSNDKQFLAKPFGWLQIILHPLLEETLHVNFKAKETVWRYIIMSDHLQDLMEPAVINSDTKDAFTGPVWLDLPDGKKRMAFESKKSIPLSSRPIKVFQLVEHFKEGSGKYKVVFGALPNPNIKLISLIQPADASQKNIFSEIFI